MSVPTLTRRRPTRPENGARMTVSSSRACAAASRARFAFSVASSCSKLDFDSACVDQQFAAAVVLALALGDRRLRGRDVGAHLRVVELHQHLAALHALAVAERDRRDDVGDLGADVDRFIRARVAERFELLRDALARAPARA